MSSDKEEEIIKHYISKEWHTKALAVTMLNILRELKKSRTEEATFTLFKFCQNCHIVLTHDVQACPICKNPRVRGNCSQVWLRSKGLVDV